jgi:hypothetical protein
MIDANGFKGTVSRDFQIRRAIYENVLIPRYAA